MAKDLSGLPASGAKTISDFGPGAPRFTGPLVDAWSGVRFARPQRPTVVEGQPWRPSKSGACSAEIWFTANGYELSNPGVVAHWSFEMGQWVHDWLDEWFVETYPGVELEAVYRARYGGMFYGGHADALWTDPETGKKTVFEFKSINGLGYQQSVLSRHGPRDSALLQAAVNGWGLGADEIVIIYVALQVVSEAQAKRKNVAHNIQRFISEWSYPRDVYQPLAAAELDRVTHAVHAARPVRRPVGIPLMAEVTNPLTGQWTELDDAGMVKSAGNVWNCGYCPHQEVCAETLVKGV